MPQNNQTPSSAPPAPDSTPTPTPEQPPSPPPQVAPQVIVQMITPQAGERTEGLSEIKAMGEYIVQESDGKGGTVKRRVDAHGQTIT